MGSLSSIMVNAENRMDLGAHLARIAYKGSMRKVKHL